MSGQAFTPPRLHGKRKPPLLLLGLLLLCIIVMAATFGYGARIGKHNSQYISIAGEQRVLALQFVKQASEASQAKVEAFPLLQNAQYRFEESLDWLLNGNAALQLPPSPPEAGGILTRISAKWPDFNDNIDTILREEGIVRLINEFVAAINGVMPELQNLSENAAQQMIAAGNNAETVFIASRQLMLAQRIATNVNRLLRGDTQKQEISATLRQDVTRFQTVLQGLLEGNQQENIERVSDKQARQHLQQVTKLFDTIRELSLRILETSPQLFMTQQASQALFNSVEGLLTDVTDLVSAYRALEEQRKYINLAGYALGGLSLVLLLALGQSMMRSTRQRLQQEARSNQRTQQAILQLLDEISPLADGDLTAKATVGPEITGAIADAINFAVESLRQLVTAANELTREVANTAEETQATALHLSKASDHQTRQIHQVSRAVTQMTQAIGEVARNAHESAEVAENSVQLAEDGVLAVRNTIKGMSTIRNDIRDTSQRVKRLGENSQEIGEVIELINDIADQTNILALNAAIQASAAGEQGSGFAIVADEVQQLAERVAQATQRIEGLANTIQADTARTVDSMEQSTHDVLEGAKVAERAGDALMRIEAVSSHLSSLIHNISAAALQLEDSATQVGGAMENIRKIANQSLAGSKQTTMLTGKLAEAAKQQRKVVSGFKLPPQTDTEGE